VLVRLRRRFWSLRGDRICQCCELLGGGGLVLVEIRHFLIEASVCTSLWLCVRYARQGRLGEHSMLFYFYQLEFLVTWKHGLVTTGCWERKGREGKGQGLAS
jgi:hypothetical protein